MNGSTELSNMFLMFVNSSVSVRLATRLALEDIGEHLSPK